MNSKISSVCAVIVTYHPDLQKLGLLISSLITQVANVIVVDNGSSESLKFFVSSFENPTQLEIIALGENMGIGHAQNVGITFALKCGASHVVLFDQDSCPEIDMIYKLYSAAIILERSGVRLGAIAPCYKDVDGGVVSGFVRVGILGFKREMGVCGGAPIEADFLISSGSLIPIPVLEDIGGVDASLFIDHVDTEWCFRAKSKGYRLFGLRDAVMLHSLGDSRVRFWFIRWRTVPYHSPFRYYYMFRNSILLQRRHYMPLKWKIADIARCIRALIFFGLFSSSRSACLKMMFRGVVDGIYGVTGKIK